jgi:hypothetical protein
MRLSYLLALHQVYGFPHSCAFLDISHHFSSFIIFLIKAAFGPGLVTATKVDGCGPFETACCLSALALQAWGMNTELIMLRISSEHAFFNCRFQDFFVTSQEC